MKTTATMTVLLLATTLGLQAQSSASSASSQQTEEQRRNQAAYGSESSTASQPGYSPSHSSSANANASETAQQRRDREDKEKKDKEQKEKDKNRFTLKDSNSSSGAQASSPSATTASTDVKYSSNQPKEVQQDSQTASTQNSASSKNSTELQNSTASTSATTAQTGVQASSQTDVAVTGQVETEVRTLVQQIDAQGPVVVERISTEFADATCTEENARALVEALHNGTSVTLRGDDGQTATFTPTTRLGYGDAYIAMSVAVQALREAGISGCASPAQWQAVLLGGQLSGTRTTSVTTERFPGVLVLHSQGGWTQVAQTTHVQLNQIVSQAHSSLQINNSNSTSAQANNSSINSSTSSQQNLSPTGRPAGYDARAEAAKQQKEKDKDDDKVKGYEKDKHDDNGQKLGHDKSSPDLETPAKSGQPPKY